MVGTILQRPSSVSAIKIAGKTGHERVRSGEKFELPPREVTISSIEVGAIARSEFEISVQISVNCSPGTYIRAIARDLGEALGTGGHLTSLRRTLVSPFVVGDCHSWETAELMPTTIGISRILPTRGLQPDEIKEISFGRFIPESPVGGVVAALGPDGSFIALLENRTFGEKIVAAPILVSMKE
jgi:tRNA pseudouridine55 synthase